jgi:type II secretion system protein I
MSEGKMNRTMDIKGFALIEVLIALTILSTILLSVYSGVSSAIHILRDTREYTKAMVIARTRVNEFILERMRGADIQNEPVSEYPGFYFTRRTGRYENPLFGPLPAQKTDFEVTWERNQKRPYKLIYIYATQ